MNLLIFIVYNMNSYPILISHFFFFFLNEYFWIQIVETFFFP